MAAMAVASASGLHLSWLRDPEICAMVDAGGRLIKSPDGEGLLEADEQSCILNQAFLHAYMDRQRCVRNLDMADLETLKQELIQLHVQRAAARAGRRTRKLTQTMIDSTVALVDCNCHLDAKSIKRLLSYARCRLLKKRTVREACLHAADVDCWCVLVVSW